MTYDRYNLISVDADPLPAIVDSGSDWYEEVMSGRVDLYTDGKFETMFTWRRTSESTGVTTESETEGGTYTIVGNSITATYTGGGSISGTISGSQLTVMDDGVAFVFQK